MRESKRIVIGISGASGAVYGVRLLELLSNQANIETHLVMSKTANITIQHETDRSAKDVRSLADITHVNSNLAATISSGSFKTDGMVIAPCSMKTLSGIVNSYSDNLLIRAADVMLKDRRKLILLPRESPLHTGHCKLLYEASRMGAIICPPMPAFYNRPDSIDDIVNHTVGRILDLLDIETDVVKRWQGI